MMFDNLMTIVPIVVAVIFVLGASIWAFNYLRQIVDPNLVHIVQSANKTISYGSKTQNGNVYYKWPSWIPFLGVTTVVLPISNFDLSLNSYEAYDRDKVPFKVDVTAFFRIEDTNEAALRVSSKQELDSQLLSIVQGAVRTILATYTIDEIMLQREIFGQAFTEAVTPQLTSWGVVPVKNLELMDIRDAHESRVIHNIMAKKKSHIEMESRIEVANNMQRAQEAEIQAKQEVDLKSINANQTVEVRNVEAQRLVGEKNAEKNRVVGIANEQSQQEVASEQAVTAEKNMAVKRVNTVRDAEIERDRAEVALAQAGFNADAVVREGKAEAEKRKLIFEADKALEIRLQVQKETSIGIAQALAQGGVKLVPNVYIGGGDSETGPANAMDTLTKIAMVNMVGNSDDVI